LFVSVLAFAGMLSTGAPREVRLVLAIPFGFAAIGFLQARQKT